VKVSMTIREAEEAEAILSQCAGPRMRRLARKLSKRLLSPVNVNGKGSRTRISAFMLVVFMEDPKTGCPGTTFCDDSSALELAIKRKPKSYAWAAKVSRRLRQCHIGTRVDLLDLVNGRYNYDY
jgi:hypothetical protein